MNINENVSFNAQITVKDTNGMDTPVMYLSATLDAGNMNININCNTTNKTLVTANSDEVKQQFSDFESTVKNRAKDLGFVIF